VLGLKFCVLIQFAVQTFQSETRNGLFKPGTEEYTSSLSFGTHSGMVPRCSLLGLAAMPPCHWKNSSITQLWKKDFSLSSWLDWAVRTVHSSSTWLE